MTETLTEQNKITPADQLFQLAPDLLLPEKLPSVAAEFPLLENQKTFLNRPLPTSFFKEGPAVVVYDAPAPPVLEGPFLVLHEAMMPHQQRQGLATYWQNPFGQCLLVHRSIFRKQAVMADFLAVPPTTLVIMPGENERMADIILPLADRVVTAIWMNAPLLANQQERLAEKLGWKDWQVIEDTEALSNIHFEVAGLLTQYQKQRRLVHVLTQTPMATLILTQSQSESARLSETLNELRGLDRKMPLTITHRRPSDPHQRLIHWEVPASLSAYFTDVYRVAPEHALLFYTKEDYGKQQRRSLHRNHNTQPLQQIRRWVLSKPCRRQSLSRFWQGDRMPSPPPCGQCDNCLRLTAPPPFAGILRDVIRGLLY